MQFEEKIRDIIEEECEDYFLGTVDLSLLKNPMIQQYNSLISQYPRAISVGITLPYMAADELLKKSIMIYKETNCKLRVITSRLGNLLEKAGYNAISIPKAKILNSENFVSFHELAANMANLGRIEDNLLITPEAGPKVNWGTVLTDANLLFNNEQK